MDASTWVRGVVIGSALLSAVGSLPAGDLYEVDVKTTGGALGEERVSPDRIRARSDTRS